MKSGGGTKPFLVVTHQANESKLQAARLGRYLAECELV